VQLLASKLQEHGVLAFHISNRYLELEPVLGNIAAQLGLTCMARKEEPAAAMPERVKSHWVVMARSPMDFGRLVEQESWHAVPADRSAQVWTDDFSNVLSVFKWR
jgi:hypothetical protein